MTEPTDADKAFSSELCKLAGCECDGTGAIGRSVTRADHGCGGDERRCEVLCPVPVEDVEYDECERYALVASAMSTAREQGRREERRACWEMVKEIGLPDTYSESALDALADAIAARGPMSEEKD